MDQRRYILFIVLSFGILVGYMQLTAMMRGPEQPAANGRAAADDQDTDIRADQDNAAKPARVSMSRAKS